jgi:hypothetical protein
MVELESLQGFFFWCSVARVLGFQRVTAQVKKEIDAELAVLIENGVLISRNDLVSVT